MTVVIGGQEATFYGLSTEEKPANVSDGTVYYAVDTKKAFIYYKGTWYEQ